MVAGADKVEKGLNNECMEDADLKRFASGQLSSNFNSKIQTDKSKQGKEEREQTKEVNKMIKIIARAKQE